MMKLAMFGKIYGQFKVTLNPGRLADRYLTQLLVQLEDDKTHLASFLELQCLNSLMFVSELAYNLNLVLGPVIDHLYLLLIVFEVDNLMVVFEVDNLMVV